MWSLNFDILTGVMFGFKATFITLDATLTLNKFIERKIEK